MRDIVADFGGRQNLAMFEAALDEIDDLDFNDIDELLALQMEHEQFQELHALDGANLE